MKKIIETIGRTLSKKDRAYFINDPIQVRYNQWMGPFRVRHWLHLKSVFVNERIVEHPFAIQCLNDVPKGSKVLDLGCSESSLPMQMATLGYRVTGIDLRPFPYIHPNFTFVEGDILKLPFEDGTYDAVFSISTIEHVGIGAYEDPQAKEDADYRAVLEAHRVLKRGGIFCLTVPFGMLSVNKHQRVYDRQALEDLLRDFRVEDMKCFLNSREKTNRVNFWKEVDQEEVANIKNADCVCLVKAIK